MPQTIMAMMRFHFSARWPKGIINTATADPSDCLVVGQAVIEGMREPRLGRIVDIDSGNAGQCMARTMTAGQSHRDTRAYVALTLKQKPASARTDGRMSTHSNKHEALESPVQPAVPEKRAYRKSSKREETQLRNRRKIEQAAWKIFAEQGLDATATRDIITASGVSPGTFYNYYESREQIFIILLNRLVEKIHQVAHREFNEHEIWEQRLKRSFCAFLKYVFELPQGRAFCERNQHHIRAKLHKIEATERLLEDMRLDYRQPEQAKAFNPSEETLVVGMIFAIGLEALFVMSSDDSLNAESISSFVAHIATHGLKSWSAL